MKHICAYLLLCLLLSGCAGALQSSGGNPKSVGAAPVSDGRVAASSGGENAGQGETSSGLLEPPEKASRKADPANDKLSEKALVGEWGFLNMYGGQMYSFEEDGSFCMVLVVASISSYSTGSRYSAAMNLWQEGKYRVKSGTIELYDIRMTSDMAFDQGYYVGDPDAMDHLKVPDDKLHPTGDQLLEFEFLSAGLLRIRQGDSDSDLEWRGGDAHDAAIPTHEIPAAPWPQKALSPDMPVFTGGRIRHVRAEGGEDVADEYKTYRITIDKTNKEALGSYWGELENAGWTLYWDSGGGSCSSARKGLYYLYFDLFDMDAGKLGVASTKSKEGTWPAKWLSSGIYPPKGSLIIGEIDTSSWVYKEGIYLSVELEHMPAAKLREYFAELDAQGWRKPDFGIYDNERFHFLRIDGDMFMATVHSSETAGNVSKMSYCLTYYEDSVWPTDSVPPELIPPSGCDLIGEIFAPDEPAEGGYFGFTCYPMDAEGVKAYFKTLESRGWKASDFWENEMILKVRWRGRPFLCSIRLWDITDGTGQFQANFHPDD